jgi:uncharacterized protein (TIGR00725 family)
MDRVNGHKKIIGVIGASRASYEGLCLAEEVGRLIAGAGATLVCGGLGGVMEAASRGCCEAGGEVLGILPGPVADDANPYVTLAIPTNMGHARNMIIAHTAEALVAIEGAYGTFSEAAIALKLDKQVFALRPKFAMEGLTVADSAAEAVEKAIAAIT